MPLKAYGIVAVLSDRCPVTPVMIYRSLDFLVSHRLAVKLRTLNAYVACIEPVLRTTNVSIFVCSCCSQTACVPDPRVFSLVESQAASLGFAVAEQVIEARGVCLNCQSAGALPR